MQLDLTLVHQVRNGSNFIIFPVYPAILIPLREKKTHQWGSPSDFRCLHRYMVDLHMQLGLFLYFPVAFMPRYP